MILSTHEGCEHYTASHRLSSEHQGLWADSVSDGEKCINTFASSWGRISGRGSRWAESEENSEFDFCTKFCFYFFDGEVKSSFPS